MSKITAFRDNTGISLIELLVAVTILAFVMAFLVPNAMRYIHRANVVVIQSEAQTVADAVELYLEDLKENGNLRAGSIHRLMNLSPGDANSVLKNYVSGGKNGARIVSVDVNLKTGELRSLLYGNELVKIKITIDKDRNRSVEEIEE